MVVVGIMAVNGSKWVVDDIEVTRYPLSFSERQMSLVSFLYELFYHLDLLFLLLSLR